jgi:SseB protein N-terminal domain
MVIRSIPPPEFPGDEGRPYPPLARALSALAEGSGSAVAVLAALTTARLLVPVVHVSDSPTSAADEHASAMAAVTIRGRDGRSALLAFTCLDALQIWRPDARPVPVPAQQAAAAALTDGVAALSLDLAGPVPYVVSGRALSALAAGYRVASRPDGGYSWIVPVIHTPGR